MVSRRRLLLGSAAALGTIGLGAGATAWASTRAVTPTPSLVGGGMPLPDGTVCPVDYLSRAGWGADEAWRTWPAGPEEWHSGLNDYQREKYTRYPVRTITVHHTAGPNPASAGAAAQLVRDIYHYQAITQGWEDIGYNLMIDPFGIVYEGRYSIGDPWPMFGPLSDGAPLLTSGAHVGGYNTGNIGICLLGNFHQTSLAPTAEAIEALVRVVTDICRLWGLDPMSTVHYYNPVRAASQWDNNQPAVPEYHATRVVPAISGHGDWAVTSCPGSNLYPLLEPLRQDVARRLPPVPPRGRPAPEFELPVPSPSRARPAPSVPPSPSAA